MNIIKVDAALLVDSFSVFHSRNTPIVWCHLKFLEKKNNNEPFKIDLDEISKELNIKFKFIKSAIKKLTLLGLLIINEKGLYYTTSERELFNLLRSKRKEKFYTRIAVINIEEQFFYKFISKINDPLLFRIYFYLIIMGQHDLWPDEDRIRCQITMYRVLRFASVWCMETTLVECFNNLIDLGLILIDQKHRVHTFSQSSFVNRGLV